MLGLQSKMEYFHQNHHDLYQCVAKTPRTNIFQHKFLVSIDELHSTYEGFLSLESKDGKL